MWCLQRILVLACCLVGLTGCASLAYYSQSVIGHSKLMWSRVPIDTAIEQARASGDLEFADNLELSKRIRVFAVEQLGLPENKSYTSFAQTPDDYPVYTVVAAPEFSVQAKQWCYPVIGCASYRGYFDAHRAQQYALSLQQHGYETSVGGATAYSTLGWFADPLLPSMVRLGESNLAEVLFHELAHQRLYINGDSAFNEAFATLIGEHGAKRWLAANQAEQLPNYQQRLEAIRGFNELLLSSKKSLAEAYAANDSPPQMRAAKQAVFSQLKADYEFHKTAHWGGDINFDEWFAVPLNNARLAGLSTYYEKLPVLEDLLNSCQGDLRQFYASLEDLESVDGEVTIPQECAA